MILSKKQFFILLIILIGILIFNNEVTANFETVNSSGIRIDSLKIEPKVITNGKYISLNPNEKKEYKAKMKGIPKTDGSYLPTYKINNEITVQRFGYYTNGSPTEKITLIEITNKGLKYNAEFGVY